MTRGYDPLGYLNQPSVAESQAMWDELSTPSYWDNINKMKEESRERYGRWGQWHKPDTSGFEHGPYDPWFWAPEWGDRPRRPGQNPWDRSPHHRPQNWEGGQMQIGITENTDEAMEAYFGGATDDQVGNNENIIRNSVNNPRVTSQTFG